MMHRIVTAIQRVQSSRGMRLGITLLLLTPYLAYIAFVISNDQGPVDYETFIHHGRRLLEGGEIYGKHNYYPLPYVIIFSLFSLLPRSVSVAIWLGGPVVIALAAAGFRPYVLLFAPVFSHFSGGQSSVFGLLGFLGYRRNLDPSSYCGGVFLALTTLKPQLAIVPIGYAVYVWINYYRNKREVPRQILSFAGTVGLFYIPTLAIRSEWLVEWLTIPRPLFNRALSGAVPRLLLMVASPDGYLYWVLWAIITIVVLGTTWKLKGSSHPFDILLLASFIVNPLVHDYDLIQVIPTIWGPVMRLSSVILSIPGWWTITTNYAIDSAWVTFTIIAPGLLIAYIIQCRLRMRGDVGSRATRCFQPADDRLENDNH